MAANIDAAITRKGMTNRAVGEAMGTTEHQVWRWRKGKHKPTYENLIALAVVLEDGDVAAFFTGHDEVAA